MKFYSRKIYDCCKVSKKNRIRKSKGKKEIDGGVCLRILQGKQESVDNPDALP